MACCAALSGSITRPVEFLCGKMGRTTLSAPAQQDLACDRRMFRSGQIDSVQCHFSPRRTTGLNSVEKSLCVNLGIHYTFLPKAGNEHDWIVIRSTYTIVS